MYCIFANITRGLYLWCGSVVYSCKYNPRVTYVFLQIIPAGCIRGEGQCISANKTRGGLYSWCGLCISANINRGLYIISTSGGMSTRNPGMLILLAKLFFPNSEITFYTEILTRKVELWLFLHVSLEKKHHKTTFSVENNYFSIK